MKQLVFKKNQKINKKMIFVSKENLSHNYRQIDKFSGNSKVISVIKGDGYGHGLLECCKILKTNKCKDFYVARLDDAIKLVSTERGKLGAVSNRLSSTIANLEQVGVNLSASKGRIADADFAAETGNLAKNQILQQAATAMLAQANAAPQTVLALLQ